VNNPTWPHFAFFLEKGQSQPLHQSMHTAAHILHSFLKTAFLHIMGIGLIYSKWGPSSKITSFRTLSHRMMADKSVQESRDGESSPDILPPLMQHWRTHPGHEQHQLAHLLPILPISAIEMWSVSMDESNARINSSGNPGIKWAHIAVRSAIY
jgi:hypothetical protein